MAKKTTSKKASPKTTTAPETKAAKPPREKKEQVAKEDLMTFAFRMLKTESAALHKAAGSGRASRVMRALAGAFASGDRAVFETIVDEAREARQ